MKEVFSKSFWEGVKKTFDEAREGPPVDKVVKIPAEVDPVDTSTPELSASRGADPASIEPAGGGQEAERIRPA